MKKYILFMAILLPAMNSRADTKPVMNLDYTISTDNPTSVEFELVNNLDELLYKEVVSFGKKVQKKQKIKVLMRITENKRQYMNGVILLDAVHAEYRHNTLTEDYYANVTLKAVIQTPDQKEFFQKDYRAQGTLHLGTQWSSWIGIKKVTRFTLTKALDTAARDQAFIDALHCIDHNNFYKDISKTTAPEILENKKIPTIEERLKTLESLKEKGLLTEEEYQRKKQDILEEL